MSKCLGRIIGCKYKTSSWHLNGFPDGRYNTGEKPTVILYTYINRHATGSPMVVTFGQQYNTGEKPTVILYTYINRHAGTPDKNKTKTFLVHFIIIYSNSAMDPYTMRACSLEHKQCYNIVIGKEQVRRYILP